LAARAFLAVSGLLATVSVAAPVLDRDVSHYILFGFRRVGLKNFTLEPGQCHVGVDCARATANSECGGLRGKGVKVSPTSQFAGDIACLTGSFYEVFRNNVAMACGPVCSMVGSPGPASDCTSPFATPLVGDLDGDGTPSCSDDCVPDPGDVAAACGLTLPFPACDPGRPITVHPNEDCSSDDGMLGNFQCDLPAGTYGTITVRDGARISFAAGTTVACRLKAGKATRVTSVGPARVLVPGSGSIRINNGLDVGSTCGKLLLATERGPIHFGRRGDVTADACTIFGTLKLGHSNNLHGRYIGSDIQMDFNNEGRCCDTTTTSSTSTTLGTTSTTTATLGTTTSTSTTMPDVNVTTTSTSTTLASTSTTTSSTLATVPTSTSTTSTTHAPTSTTTLPQPGFTRTIGFYKNHPAITAQILGAHGPLMICGHAIADVDVDHAHSALEALCVSPQGDQRLQLVRQLTAAALSTAAGGGHFDLAPCNAVCADPGASVASLTACIDQADAFNNSGDNVRAPWDPPGRADSNPCGLAMATPCTVLDPSACSAP
jgi:hypothetical protein